MKKIVLILAFVALLMGCKQATSSTDPTTVDEGSINNSPLFIAVFDGAYKVEAERAIVSNANRCSIDAAKESIMLVKWVPPAAKVVHDNPDINLIYHYNQTVYNVPVRFTVAVDLNSKVKDTEGNLTKYDIWYKGVFNDNGIDNSKLDVTATSAWNAYKLNHAYIQIIYSYDNGSATFSLKSRAVMVPTTTGAAAAGMIDCELNNAVIEEHQLASDPATYAYTWSGVYDTYVYTTAIEDNAFATYDYYQFNAQAAYDDTMTLAPVLTQTHHVADCSKTSSGMGPVDYNRTPVGEYYSLQNPENVNNAYSSIVWSDLTKLKNYTNVLPTGSTTNGQVDQSYQYDLHDR